MSRTVTGAGRFRRATAAVAAAVALPFALAACAEDEPVDEGVVEEGDPVEEETQEEEDDGLY